jgi:hypothetical protein
MDAYKYRAMRELEILPAHASKKSNMRYRQRAATIDPSTNEV